MYFALSEASTTRGTLGKRVLHLRVQSTNGQPLRVPAALLRSAVKFLPWELAHFTIWHLVYAGPGGPQPWTAFALGSVYLVASAYLLTLFIGKTHRTLYDRLSGSIVVA